MGFFILLNITRPLQAASLQRSFLFIVFICDLTFRRALGKSAAAHRLRTAALLLALFINYHRQAIVEPVTPDI